jgi:hypothetical protein
MIINFLGKHQKKAAWMLWFIFYAEMVTAAFVKNNTGYVMQSYAGYRHVNSSERSLRIFEKNFSDFGDPLNYLPIGKMHNPKNEKKLSAGKKVFIGGPGQPEMQAFQSVNSNNMVDLFSGDFSYNIPLIDVGGYPLGISYRSGATMDQEASWVGLGWNINPGTIMRNVRGLPDDFDGTEKITKTYNVRKNWTAGITAMSVPELFGLDVPRINANIGAFYNNYNGIGFEAGAGVSVNPGKYMNSPKTTTDETEKAKVDTSFTTKNVGGSLNFSLNSQSGLNLGASFMMKYGSEESKYNGVSKIGLNYNSRAGLQDLQISAEAFNNRTFRQNIKFNNGSTATSGTPIDISFAKASYTPTITIPMSSYGFSFTIKGGGALFGFHPLGALKGYYSQQYIKEDDRTMRLPAYGYMHYQKGNRDDAALLDFNREKDIPFRTQTPHAAIPIYTYDTYSISGEGIGGSFRPYRGDVGYIRDHALKTKSGSGGIGVDLGAGPNIAHIGGDIQFNYATVQNGRWLVSNFMERKVRFQDNDSTYEAVYFRNPGEQTTNTQDYYDKIGGDDVVRVGLAGGDLEPIATPSLYKFDKQKATGSVAVNSPIIKDQRDKRTQVISYLTAAEARRVGLDTIIKSYPINTFPKGKCDSSFEIINRVDNTDGIRMPNHISEIDVLNADGRRYIYGLPAYNITQKEVTFAVSKSSNGSNSTGLVTYETGDNTVDNNKGKDNFFSSDVTPGYAHSYLLTGLLSPDYVDITGDGITEDDNGDAVKFNYSRMKWVVSGQSTTNFKWRAPYEANKATFNEGIKTDRNDDKGSYVYGEKEIWYMNSIESKTMVATFVLDNTIRTDDYGVLGENGGINTSYGLKRLKEINLYSKSDYYKNPAKARPIKTVHFAYSYSLCPGIPSSSASSGKLTLDSVWFTYNGSNRGVKNKYRFTYSSNNPSYNNKSYDRWGNYKPDTDNPNNVPNAEYPYATQDKTKADANVAAWNITQVKLPSGAAIKVDYEADNYAYVQNKRAMNMMKIAGMGTSSNPSLATSYLYDHSQDYRYVFINVSSSVSTKLDVYTKYLEGVDKIYFRMRVKMPGNSGYEMIPFYAEYEDYGVASSNKIWIKLKEFGRDQSFPAIAAIQFLRLNLPSLAYPGSDVSDNAGARAAIQAVLGMGRQFKDALVGFSKSKRQESACRLFDTTKSYARLDNPDYYKYGGGLRVKRIIISDNWYNMTGQKESFYGQEYDYTTIKEVNYDSSGFFKNKKIKISSGVASYEPNVGNEENPFRQPIEFQESVTLAPTDYLYSEYPYCESFFPSASVGYSKVTVSSINKKNLKSFNGWEESEFYTTYDFPTVTDYTTFDPLSRKRGKQKFSFINSLSVKRATLSQGFKIELNDMNGKMKSQKSYAANDSIHPIAYTINYYKTQQDNVHGVNLSNTVNVLDSANGKINQSGTVGKDIELMMDFREQQSLSTSVNVNLNTEVFTVFIFPVVIPAFFPVFNIDDNRYRSAVAVKVVQRYGILDSVIYYEKGSLVSTKNVIYDAQTGDVLLSRTQNEFNDPVYNFNYPAHWVYSGLEPASRNISAIYKGINIDGGKIDGSSSYGSFERHLESGDELLVMNDPATAGTCAVSPQKDLAANAKRLWIVDINKTSGASGRELYVMDRFGNPYTGTGVDIKIIRSGKRNMASTSVGSVISLREPIDKSNPANWQLKLDSTIGVIGTVAAIYKDTWAVDNRYVSEYKCDTIVKYDSLIANPAQVALEKYAINASDGVMENGIILNANVLAGSFEYQHYKQSSQANCKTKYGNCSYQTHSIKYITRGILDFNFSSIPHEAVIDNASLSLSAKPPIGLWSHSSITNSAGDCGNYWPSNVSVAHDYFDRAYYPSSSWDNAGYIKRITSSWNASTQFDPFTNSLSETNKLTLSAAHHTSASYNLTCTALIQDYLANPSYGFAIMQSNETDNGCNRDQIRHLSFCSGYSSTYESYIGYASSCSSPEIRVRYHYSKINCHDTCVSVFSRRINPYVQGIWGNWRVNASYTFYDDRKENNPLNPTDIRKDGEFKKFVPFWYFGSPQLTKSNYARWIWTSEVTRFNKRGLETENKDPLGRYNSGLYGYNQTLPIAVAENAKYRQIAFDGFEDYNYKNDSCDQRCPPARHLDFSFYKNKIDSTQKHTGKSSLKLSAGDSISITVPVVSFSNDSTPAELTTAKTFYPCVRLDSITANNNMITPVFSPIQGDSMIVGVWVKEAQDCSCSSYVYNQVKLVYSGTSGQIGATVILKPSGNIIEGWQRYEEKIVIPSTATSMVLRLKNISSGGSSTSVYFDDIRLHPFNSSLKSFVYHSVNLRLLSELDENNYASFYEYDDEGTLVRVKKETQNGIKTVTETRSALIKQ